MEPNGFVFNATCPEPLVAMAFSHHSSNPLEAKSSDNVNTAYNRAYTKVTRQYPASSDDELGNWDTDQQRYAEHVEQVVGRNPMEITPKAFTRAFVTPTKKDVDLDEDMSSDPLATPFREGQTTIDPRRLKVEEDEPEPMNMDEEEYGDEEVDEEPEEHEIKQEYEEGDQHSQDFDGIKKEEYEDQDDLADYHQPFSDGDEDMLDGSLSPLTPLSSNQSSPFSSPQSSRPPSPDEARTLYNLPEDEQEEINSEIASLYRSVPELKHDYELVDRLGTGTFSSVYKAIDLHYDEWDNGPWLGNHPPESSAFYQSAGPGFRGRGGRAPKTRGDEPKDGRVYVAIKRIYTTSGPERIRNEINIMETCRGCRHSSQIITAFRNNDQVVVVLPYQRNMDFREFFQQLHPEGIKCYFRCLFRALRDIHSRGIIHRDVKPANFLYDPFTGIGTLCDFGLASRIEKGGQSGRCLHTIPTPDLPHGKTVTLDEQRTFMVKRVQREARLKSLLPAERVGYPQNDRRPISKANRAGTRGFRAPEVLLKCGTQTGAVDVWSAGVILLFFLSGKFPIFQSNDDIEALMEIAVILGKKKIERAATLHGRTIATNVPDIDHDGLSWQEFAEKLNPELMTPRKYDMRYYPHNAKHRDGRGSSTTAPPPQPPQSSSPTSESIDADLLSSHDQLAASTSNSSTSMQGQDTETQHAAHSADRHANPPSLERHTKEMRNAFDLLEAVLHFESTKRMTPRSALYHPFLAEPGVAGGDDVFAPHRVGEGVCAKYHEKDDVSEQVFVKIFRKCLCLKVEGNGSDGGEEGGENEDEAWCGGYEPDHVEAAAGEGIAIGNRPCEFHTGPQYELD